MKKIELKITKNVIDPDIRDFLHFIDMSYDPFIRGLASRIPVSGVFIILAYGILHIILDPVVTRDLIRAVPDRHDFAFGIGAQSQHAVRGTYMVPPFGS